MKTGLSSRSHQRTVGEMSHPWSSALWASIPNSPRSPHTFFGKLTSSSHIRRVQNLRRDSHHFWDRLARKLSVGFLDFLDAHPLGQARQNKRDGESGSPNREFAAQEFRI